MYVQPPSEAAAFTLFSIPLYPLWDAVDIYTHLLYPASQNTSILSSSSHWENCKTATYPTFIYILSDAVWGCAKSFKTITRAVMDKNTVHSVNAGLV